MKDKERKKTEGKKTEGKLRSRLMVCLLYVAVLSAATYAWFSVNNKPKVYNLALIVSGPGDLLIADDLGNGPGVYSYELDLAQSNQTPVAMADMELRPVTTTDVRTFYEPIYNGDTVIEAREITDQTLLNDTYVYQKTFYLKAGSIRNDTGQRVGSRPKSYDIMLLGPEQSDEYTGCVIRQTAGAATEGEATSINALRIAFIIEDGQDEIKVYEPNSAQHNTGLFAINGLNQAFGGYPTLQQPLVGGDFEGGDGHNSEVLFTIQEEVDVKVTMLVWIEGTDDDCTNSIQMDEIMGNIQFISKEAVYNR